MRIILNNRVEEIGENILSVGDLLRIKNYTFRMLVIKINDKLVKKDEREITLIKEGDEVLVLHMISGG